MCSSSEIIIDQITGLIELRQTKNILIICGKKSFFESGASEKLEALKTYCNIYFFNNFSKNPTIEDIHNGIKIFKSKNIDFIIAVGGGSAIDTAKLIRAFGVLNKKISKSDIESKKDFAKSKIPLVAIPTTYGSGSESTQFAVIYIDNQKFSVNSQYLLPNFYVLESELCLSLPKDIAASCSIDALSQAIESFWSIKSTNKSKDYAKKAIGIIMENIEEACKGNKKSIYLMLQASNLSGKAINISTTTAPHAISYPLTIFHNIPHGHAVAITLGYFFEINFYCNTQNIQDLRGVAYLKETMQDLFNTLGCNNATECKQKWKELMRALNLETSLKKLQIDKNDIERISEYINIERLANNPVKISSKEIKDILYN